MIDEVSDRFSQTSADYCQHRFGYPKQMIEDVVALCEGKGLALDCGTGTGQVPKMLHADFGKVVGIDMSEEQINHAFKADNVSYRVNAAEDLGFLDDESVDLITVGTAFHWFEQEKFFKEAKRVLKKGGVLAMFGVNAPELVEGDDVLGKFFDEKVVAHIPESKNKGVQELGELDGFESVDFAPTYSEVEPKEVEDITGWVRTTSSWPVLVETGEADSILDDLRGRLRAVKEDGPFELVNSAYIKVYKRI